MHFRFCLLPVFFLGAVQSGYRAAAEVIQDLHPDSLSSQDLKLIEESHPKVVQKLNVFVRRI